MCDIIIKTANSNGTIFVVGNGGSSSISSHVALDFLKALGIRPMITVMKTGLKRL